jgi:hypothetical protein
MKVSVFERKDVSEEYVISIFSFKETDSGFLLHFLLDSLQFTDHP